MKRGIVLFLVIMSSVFLTGCWLNDNTDGLYVPDKTDEPIPGEPINNNICPAIYAPVCGEDGTTYSNKCVAGDVEIAYDGECQIDKDIHECTAQERAAQACTMDYNPVCGADGVTYSNGCSACSSGVSFHIPGECED